MNIKDRLMHEQPRICSNFEMCTKDFKSIKMETFYGENLYASKVKYLDVDYIEPYMIYIIFVKILEFEHTYKPFEKVLYEIPFQFQGYYCMFSMGKFGLQFNINTKEVTVLKAIFKKIKSASKITEGLLKPIITESIDTGNLTIENQSGILRQRYLYFRERAEQIYSNYKDGKYHVC